MRRSFTAWGSGCMHFDIRCDNVQLSLRRRRALACWDSGNTFSSGSEKRVAWVRVSLELLLIFFLRLSWSSKMCSTGRIVLLHTPVSTLSGHFFQLVDSRCALEVTYRAVGGL